MERVKEAFHHLWNGGHPSRDGSGDDPVDLILKKDMKRKGRSLHYFTGEDTTTYGILSESLESGQATVAEAVDTALCTFFDEPSEAEGVILLNGEEPYDNVPHPTRSIGGEPLPSDHDSYEVAARRPLSTASAVATKAGVYVSGKE